MTLASGEGGPHPGGKNEHTPKKDLVSSVADGTQGLLRAGLQSTHSRTVRLLASL